MFNRTFRLKKNFKGDPLWEVGVERDGFINKTYPSFSDLFFFPMGLHSTVTAHFNAVK